MPSPARRGRTRHHPDVVSEGARWTIEVYPDGRIEPCLAVPSRYHGTYEGGEWLAFPCEAVPDGAYGGDTECSQWFASNGWWVGIGATEAEARSDLLEKLDRLAESGQADVHRWDRGEFD